MKLITLFFVLIFKSIIISQSIAITENGDSVVLYNDGTWEYFNQYSDLSDSSISNIDTNQTDFKKPNNSTKLLKGQKIKYELWYNGDNWKLMKNDKPHIEYMLSDQSEEMYCMIIPERVSLTIDALKQAAIANAKNAGKDFEMLDQEIRKVNNKYVHMMKFRVTIQGIKFVYLGYYYAEDSSSLQLLTMTTDNLFDEHEAELENILNGLVY